MFISTVGIDITKDIFKTYVGKKLNISKLYLACLLLWFTSVALSGQRAVSSRIAQHFAHQLNVFPQEKIHLHTDRDIYVPGERICFKAYLVDATTHIPAMQSRYVYIELISPADTLVRRVMIRHTEENLFFGHLFLSEVIPEGDYTLRAYTRYMENLGDDYFFKKNIRIGSLTANKSQTSQSFRNGRNRENSENRRNRNRTADYEVSFFPEGGNLVEGVLCKVAFKVLNRNGYSEAISGEIVDETGSVITTVQTLHAGMGVFPFFPDRSKRYYMRCRNGNGTEKRFELPRPDPRAYALTVSQHKQRISVGIQKPFGSLNPSGNSFYLLTQCRGEVLYFSEWDNRKDFIVFEEERLPAGVIQFILFDDLMNPLSERLVFNKNYDKAKLEFKTDKASYEKREKVTVTLKELSSLTPSLSERGQGVRCSVAITDDMDITVDGLTTILSTLLLSSELKGYIENPAYYLQDNPASAVALNYLMMTHGWRRYAVPDVVNGNIYFPQIQHQTSQELSGMTTGFLSQPTVGSEIIIMTEDGGFGLTSTDERGVFRFRDFEFPDSTSFFVRALSRRGTGNVVLALDSESFPKPVHAPQSQVIVATDNYPSLHTNDFIAKAEQRARYDEDMRVIHLEEVVVSASRIEQKELRDEYWMNKSSDITIRREEMGRVKFSHVAEYINLIPGAYAVVDFASGTYGIRLRGGPSSLSLGSSPLIFVDGVPDVNLNDIRPEDVESIDVFRGVNAAIFGTRGTNGAISITTRRGGEDPVEPVNYTVYTPLGYQKPVEFYSPKYETLEDKHLAIPDYRTTIFWKPDVVISEAGEAGFEFYTSDFPTTYSVVIEGLTTDGRIVRQVEKIQVE